jgi:hypothetical protein
VENPLAAVVMGKEIAPEDPGVRQSEMVLDVFEVILN